ncbi:hypothetical protein K6025_04400 [Ehrlichia sp. JZT12]
MKKLFLFVAMVSFINATAGFTHGMYPHDDMLDSEMEDRKVPVFQDQDIVDDEDMQYDELDKEEDDIGEYDQQMDEGDHLERDQEGVVMKDHDEDSDEHDDKKDMSDGNMKKKKIN